MSTVVKEFDKVLLTSGRTGFAIEVFDDAILFEFSTPDGPSRYDDEIVPLDDVKEVMSR